MISMLSLAVWAYWSEPSQLTEAVVALWLSSGCPMGQSKWGPHPRVVTLVLTVLADSSNAFTNQYELL
jgi:hypothetical protein